MSDQPRAIIFTALKVETEAVAVHLDGLHAVRWENAVHQRGNFPEGLGWDVLVVQTGPENQVAALETQAALLNFEPAVAIFVGIAGGFKAKGIGEFDLVVPPRVEYYQAGKAESSFTLRPRQQGPTHYLISAARQVEREEAWLNRLEPAAGEQPTVHLEPLASGDHVVKSLDSETYKLIRASLDQAVAVDMESSGFLFATSLRPGVESAVVRGVSDLLSDKDLGRDASRQPKAAQGAAAFAFELLATTPQEVLSIRDLPIEPKPWGSGASPQESAPDAGTPHERADDRPGDDDGLGQDAARLGEELAEILDVDRWHQWTEGIFFGNPPAISIDFDQRLDAAFAWTSNRIGMPGLESVLDAIANLGTILRDFRDVFHQEVEASLDGRRLHVAQFYRQYDKPTLERERLIAEYGKHTLLIKDLGAELTRAVNLVDERIRNLEPRYRVAQGAAGIFAGTDESFLVVRYSEEERTLPIPYPGLSEFREILGSRDGSFGPYRDRDPWPEEVLDRFAGALAAGDLPAAHKATFEFAVLVAGRLPAREPILVAGGPRGGHTVRFRPVTVRWRSPDGVHTGDPVRHLARAWVNRRGEADTGRERLVGAPGDCTVGEVLEADGSVILDPLRDSDLALFGAEAQQILKTLNA